MTFSHYTFGKHSILDIGLSPEYASDIFDIFPFSLFKIDSTQICYLLENLHNNTLEI